MRTKILITGTDEVAPTITTKPRAYVLGKKQRKPVVPPSGGNGHPLSKVEKKLFSDLYELINAAKRRVAVTANSEIIMLYWHVGRRIKQDVLKNKRAAYGEELVKKASAFLTAQFGSGWGFQTVRHCVRSAYTFTEEQIVYAVRTQLSWTHLRSVMSIGDELKREFYLGMCAHEHWSTRDLDEKIDGLLYERTAISKKPERVIRHEIEKIRVDDELTPDVVFRSSYFLSLSGLKDEYAEADLEEAVLREMENVLSEFGTDFAFLGRQRRITIDATDYKMDLLFYHRSLRRIIVVDLKIGKFKPEYKGQMELYLKYLDRNNRKPWEESPMGLILCSEGNTEHIEYLMLDEKNIRVAQYFTELPTKAFLRRKLQRAVAVAQYALAERGKNAGKKQIGFKEV